MRIMVSASEADSISLTPSQSLRRQNLYAEADWKQSRLNDD